MLMAQTLPKKLATFQRPRVANPTGYRPSAILEIPLLQLEMPVKQHARIIPPAPNGTLPPQLVTCILPSTETTVGSQQDLNIVDYKLTKTN